MTVTDNDPHYMDGSPRPQSRRGVHPPCTSHDLENKRTRVLTQQQFKEDTHLPTLMRRWAKQGIGLDTMRRMPGAYGDFRNVTDYQTAMDAVLEAKQAFATLPAATKRAFSHDPSRLLAALNDPARHDELVTLGVLEAPQESATPILSGAISPLDPQDPPSPPSPEG